MSNRARFWFWALLASALMGHIAAAVINGGSYTAYWHHILGFVGILAVTGGAILGIGWFFWRARRVETLLIIGAVQAIMGAVVIYLEWGGR